MNEEWDKMDDSLVQPPAYPCFKSSLASTYALSAEFNGRLDKPFWDAVPWTTDFIDIEGEKSPSQRTRIKMCWDSQYFYVGAEMEETQLWGTIKQKNSTMYHENDFEVFLDTTGSSHEYYELEMNVLNTIWELWLHKPYKDGHALKNPHNLPNTKTAVHTSGPINDPKASELFLSSSSAGFKGWSVEVAICLSDLAVFEQGVPVSIQEGTVWRMNFSRVQYHLDIKEDTNKYSRAPSLPEQNWVWSPTGVVDIHRPERWGFVIFSNLHPKRAHFEPPQHVQAIWNHQRVLSMVYYDQRSFYEANNRFASTINELYGDNTAAIRMSNRGRLPHNVDHTVIQLTDTGYLAQLDGYKIREDCLFSVNSQFK